MIEKWFFFSDMQIPHHDKKAVDLAFKVLKWYKPDVVVNIGDCADGTSTSRWADGTTEEVLAQVNVEVEEVHEYWERVIKSAPNARLIWVEGNHDCLNTSNHRVVVKNGFKYVNELSIGEEVLSTDKDGNRVFVPIEQIHKYPGHHELHEIKSRSVRGQFTDNHRMLIKTGYNGKQREVAAKDIINRSVSVFTTAATNNLEDYPMSDEEIRLLAWCFTDSSIKYNQWIFYQSEPKDGRIRDLLNDLGIGFRESVRNRDITVIDGKKLLKPPQTQHEFFSKVSDIPWDTSTRTVLPDVVWKFSQRQVNVLLKELQYTDGTIPTSGNSVVIYCSPDGKRHQLMSLLVANGVQCSETEYRPGHWRINAALRTCSKVDRKNLKYKRVSTSDGVFCITVPTECFFVEHDGAIHLTGNSRTFDYVDKKAPALKDLITPESLWKLKEYNIEYYRYVNPPEVKMGDIYVHHGISVSKHAGDSARSDVESLGVSLVRGHSHRLAGFARTYELKGETLWGYEIGHLMDVSKADYTQVHNWQQGFAIGVNDDGFGNIEAIPIHKDGDNYFCYVGGRRFNV